jgi:hypothetical protein
MAIKRKTRKPLTLDELRCSMSTALRELETIFMDTGNEADCRIRAINSLSSLANSYTKITEISDLEARIEALEAQRLKRVI